MVWFSRKLFGTEEVVQCLFDIHYQTECELLPNAGTTQSTSCKTQIKTSGTLVCDATTIAGVELIVMAYAWSQKGVAYMISPCGTTVMHEHPYLS